MTSTGKGISDLFRLGPLACIIYSLYFYSEYLPQDILNAYVNRKMMKNYHPCIGTKMNIKAKKTEHSAKIEHTYVAIQFTTKRSLRLSGGKDCLLSKW